MSDETETIETETTETSETAAAAAALREGGDEVAALKLELAAKDRQLAREKGARTKIELNSYKDELVKEFEYADPDLITGKTKTEMKASAEKLHNAVAKVIARDGLTKGGVAATTKKVSAEDFGTAPRAAAETASGELPMEFAEMNQKIREGKMSRADVLKDINDNGPRPMVRQTIGGAIRGRQAPPQN